MLKCSEYDLTERLSKPRLSMDCRVKPGNDEMEFRSHDAIASEFCKRCSREVRTSACDGKRRGGALLLLAATLASPSNK
jgi:hypothetical protein